MKSFAMYSTYYLRLIIGADGYFSVPFKAKEGKNGTKQRVCMFIRLSPSRLVMLR